MKKLFALALGALLLFGCAGSGEPDYNPSTLYMQKSLATGMLPVALDDPLREDLGMPAIDGMYVASVEPKSAADSAKIRTGDILLQVGDVQVVDKETFAAAFHAVEGKRSVPVKVWRGGGILTLKLPLGF